MTWTGSDADGTLTTSSTLIIRTFITSNGIEAEDGVRTPVREVGRSCRREFGV